MKRLIFLILLIPVLFSCQSNNFESYQISWMGWTAVIAGNRNVPDFRIKNGSH